MEDEPDLHDDPMVWKTALVRDMIRVVHRDRWGRALMAIGWLHLAFFLVEQALYTQGDRAPAHFVPCWFLEVLAILAIMRWFAGAGWWRSTPLAGIVLRVWITFLILAFNASMMNQLMGWSTDWFKPSWATLSSFGFATMAWLFGLPFLIPAFQMYFTGLLMVRYPHLNYLIYGVSWWAALQGIGLALEPRRAREDRAEIQRTPADSESVAA